MKDRIKKRGETQTGNDPGERKRPREDERISKRGKEPARHG
jgi:hypothetical protein